MPTTVSDVHKQTRRRGAVLEQAILDAAWDELAERGWEGFTVEGVAARSGAAKSVIYRRWSDRVALAQAVLARGRETAPTVVESSGDLRTDLVTFLVGMARFLAGPFGDASRGVAVEGDPGSHASIFGAEEVVAIVSGLVDEAAARGEIGALPSPLALNVGHAVVMWEFIHTRRPPSDEKIAALVDTVWLPAIRAAGATG